jgi:hypothetical protein
VIIKLNTPFSPIADDFLETLTSIKEISQISCRHRKSRVAAVHAVTLLLAASFEEFVRQMAKEYALYLVKKTSAVEDLPDKFLEAAWHRAFSRAMRKADKTNPIVDGYKKSTNKARSILEPLWLFIEGDVSQSICEHLIHNENNMRPDEINKIFKICGITNILQVVCKQEILKNILNESHDCKAATLFSSEMNNFFDLRNEIAHALNFNSSKSPEDFNKDIDLFEAFSISLCITIEEIMATTYTPA